MASQDGMNLLPDSERQAGEAALRRASQPAKAGEVRLTMPQSTAKADDKPVKKSWWAKRKEVKAQKIAAAQADQEERARALAQMPAPAPAPKVAKPSMAAPAPVKPVSAPAPIKPTPAKTKSVKPIPVAKPAPMKVTSEPVTKLIVAKKSSSSAPAKAKRDGMMHEPESVNGFLGPKVNLVPQGVSAEGEEASWGLYAGILVVVIGVWVAVSGFALYRASQAEARVQELNARLNQVRALIREYETDKQVYTALQKQFLLVKDVIDGHVYWTPFLQKLEETTIPDVYYLGMNANRSGQVTLRAVAKSYSAAARQIRAFERASSFVESSQVNQVRQELQKGASLPVPVIAFDIQLQLVKGVFTILAPEQQ